jgi:hypothetical protein
MNLGIYAINNSWFTENVLSFNVRSIHNYRLDPLHPYVETRNFGFYLAVIAAALAAAIAVFRKPKNDLKSDQKRYLLLLAVALVLSSTLIDWNLVPEMFYSIQFPTRFLGIASMFMAVAASFGICWLVDKIKISWLKWSVLGVFIGAIAVAGWCRIPSGLDHQHIADDLSTTTMTGQNEYYTMGFLKDGFSTELADSGKLFEVYGDAEVSDFQVFQGKSRREFTVAAETDAKVELTQVYYAGYQAIDSAGDRLPTTYSEHGLVEISIPAGYNGKVASSFRNSDLTVIGMVVSATSLATLIGYAIVRWRRRK